MAPYQQQPPVAQNWDRWQHQQSGSDYTMMDHMVAYDPRTVPTSTALQRPTVATQYTMPTSYADSPVTPMSASPYGSQGTFGDYQSYSYQTPSAPTGFGQLPLRSAQRPLAPPTPPLDDERGMRLNDGRTASTVKSTYRRSPRRSVSVVKSDAGGEPKEIKTCPTFVKEDQTLQYESKKLVDVVLRKAATKKQPQQAKGNVATPESMASPPSEEDSDPQKPFKKHACPTCPARFHQRGQLVTHRRSHTGEKPFPCPICGRRVSQPGNMRAHMRRHTKTKPYRCATCGQGFASNGGMKVHVRNKHQGEPKKPCPIPGCRKDFSTIGNMKVHIDRFHEDELKHYGQLVENHEDFNTLPQDVRDILEVLLRIYKNSNKGIKGRGSDDKQANLDKQSGGKREAAHQEMTPVSPDATNATNAVHEYRQYYDQQHQQHYSVLPHPAQQPAQQPAGYLQLPVHQPQHSVYHALPQPGSYSNMGWTPGPQYH